MEGADVPSVHTHPAGQRVVEALDERNHGALARPRAAHKGEGPASWHVEVEVVKEDDVWACGVGKAHVLEVDLALDRRCINGDDLGRRIVGQDLRLAIHNVEEGGDGGSSLDEVGGEGKGLGNGERRHDEDHEYLEALVERAVGGDDSGHVPEGKRKGGKHEEVGEAEAKATNLATVHSTPLGGGQLVREESEKLLLEGEGGDGADVGDGFGGERAGGLVGLLEVAWGAGLKEINGWRRNEQV